jgi:hypothetical protein
VKGLPMRPSTEDDLQKGRYDYPQTNGMKAPAEKWMHEGIAVGPERGDWRAVKVLIMMDHEPNGNDDATMRARASAQFRVTYGEWAPKLTTKCKKMG